MGSRDRSREGIAALAGARTAKTIVPAIEPDDRYPRIGCREATAVAASRCRHCDRAPYLGGQVKSTRPVCGQPWR
jgi:hypothetical protein